MTDQIAHLQAQLDRSIVERESAHHMLNEHINSNLQFRAELIMISRKLETALAQIVEKDKLIAELAEVKKAHSDELEILRSALLPDQNDGA